MTEISRCDNKPGVNFFSTRLRRSLAAGFFGAATLGLTSPARAVPSFTQEAGERLTHASPQSVTGSYATSLRLYFIRDFQVRSATSTDGFNWSEESGIRVSSESYSATSVIFSSVTAATVLPLDTTGFRMLLSVASSTGDYRVITASSSDGLNWGLEGTKFSVATGTYVGSTQMIEEPGGGWRLYYVRPFSTGVSSSTFRVFTSTSGDQGVSWGPSTQIFSQEAQAVSPSVRTDGLRRLYYTQPLTNSTTATQILSAIEVANAGTLSFQQETGVRISTVAGTGAFGDLLALRAPESFRWRLYYDFLSTTTAAVPNIISALPPAPDLERLLPNAVARTAPASTFSMLGEIFSSSMTAKLTKTGESDIVGTVVTTVNDQTITAVFNTQNAPLGRWDLTVQNSDGQTSTLANALEINFAPGIVTRLDNVFRPLKGQKVHFDVSLFNDGHLTMEIYTLDGRKLRTLFDGDAVLGTTGYDWDARTDDGNMVASGVYLVTFKGPRLETREKVVVIK